MLEPVRLLSERALKRRQVLPGAFDDGREFELLRRKLLDQFRHFAGDALQRLVNPLGGVEQRVTLAG